LKQFRARDTVFTAPVDAGATGRHQEAIESVAVLPFANDSADADGENLATASRNPDQQSLANREPARYGTQHRVSATKERTSTRKRPGTICTFARGLGEIACSAEYADRPGRTENVANGPAVGGQYNRKPEDVFALQDDLSREIL